MRYFKDRGWRQSGANDPGALNLLAGQWGSEMLGHRLTEAAVDAVLPLAREYWVSTGLTEVQIAELYRTPIAIGDLSYRGALGVAKPEGICLDASGAGLGWHTSLLTPNSQLLTSSSQLLTPNSQLLASSSQLLASSYDLLTVVTHELGHVLGYDDVDSRQHPDHIMAGVLQPGTSRIGMPVSEWLGQRSATTTWTVGERASLVTLDGQDGGRLAAGGRRPLEGGCGVLVDRVIDDLLRDDLRSSRDVWKNDEDDEFERLLASRSGEEESEIDDFFARL